jgi:hypothetical protein
MTTEKEMRDEIEYLRQRLFWRWIFFIYGFGAGLGLGLLIWFCNWVCEI